MEPTWSRVAEQSNQPCCQCCDGSGLHLLDGSSSFNQTIDNILFRRSLRNQSFEPTAGLVETQQHSDQLEKVSWMSHVHIGFHATAHQFSIGEALVGRQWQSPWVCIVNLLCNSSCEDLPFNCCSPALGDISVHLTHKSDISMTGAHQTHRHTDTQTHTHTHTHETAKKTVRDLSWLSGIGFWRHMCQFCQGVPVHLAETAKVLVHPMFGHQADRPVRSALRC
eukprot:2242971-Amphidinium_carterae.2